MSRRALFFGVAAAALLLASVAGPVAAASPGSVAGPTLPAFRAIEKLVRW